MTQTNPPAMNLQDVRAAAERQLKWQRDCLTKPASARYQDGYSSWDDEVIMRDYILATIPPDAEQPVTADTLESWGFSAEEGMCFRHKQLTGTFCFEDGHLSWWHTGNRTVVITTRHQFAQLMTALGIQPRGITPKEGV